MKSKEVPQDDANMMRGKWKDPIYTVNEKGEYVTSYSLGWEAKNAVMQQAWDNINEKVEEVRQKVLRGELSPIAFYMEKNIMDARLLAKYIGICRWKVKRHLKQKHFQKLDRSMLDKYAAIFDITTEQLLDIENLKREEKQG
ncbi:MAG: hypothetical protein P8100_06240 [bacterium]|jgi:hypothetical protein